MVQVLGQTTINLVYPKNIVKKNSFVIDIMKIEIFKSCSPVV